MYTALVRHPSRFTVKNSFNEGFRISGLHLLKNKVFGASTSRDSQARRRQGVNDRGSSHRTSTAARWLREEAFRLDSV